MLHAADTYTGPSGSSSSQGVLRESQGMTREAMSGDAQQAQALTGFNDVGRQGAMGLDTASHHASQLLQTYKTGVQRAMAAQQGGRLPGKEAYADLAGRAGLAANDPRAIAAVMDMIGIQSA